MCRELGVTMNNVNDFIAFLFRRYSATGKKCLPTCAPNVINTSEFAYIESDGRYFEWWLLVRDMCSLTRSRQWRQIIIEKVERHPRKVQNWEEFNSFNYRRKGFSLKKWKKFENNNAQYYRNYFQNSRNNYLSVRMLLGSYPIGSKSSRHTYFLKAPSIKRMNHLQ